MENFLAISTKSLSLTYNNVIIKYRTLVSALKKYFKSLKNDLKYFNNFNIKCTLCK